MLRPIVLISAKREITFASEKIWVRCWSVDETIQVDKGSIDEWLIS